MEWINTMEWINISFLPLFVFLFVYLIHKYFARLQKEEKLKREEFEEHLQNMEKLIEINTKKVAEIKNLEAILQDLEAEEKNDNKI